MSRMRRMDRLRIAYKASEPTLRGRRSCLMRLHDLKIARSESTK